MFGIVKFLQMGLRNTLWAKEGRLDVFLDLPLVHNESGVTASYEPGSLQKSPGPQRRTVAIS